MPTVAVVQLAPALGDLEGNQAGAGGGRAVGAAIERHRPLLGVHGHVHESAGHVKIGATLCVNPGNEADAGVLRGYVVDLGPDGVERVVRVEG